MDINQVEASRETDSLVEKYVSVWNEPDPEIRHALIRTLWAPGGVHYVRSLECKGYDALETRIAGSHEENVRDGGYRFRSANDVQILRNVVMFNWEMTLAGSDTVEAVGLEFFELDDSGQISIDYQFIVS